MAGRLTPLASELRFDDVRPAPPSRGERLRRRLRRERKAPTTRLGMIARGLLRLGIWTAAASGVALLLNVFVHRNAAFCFYVTGAAILGFAFLSSAGNGRGRYGNWHGDREHRVNRSFAFILVGAIVVAIGAALEAL